MNQIGRGARDRRLVLFPGLLLIDLISSLTLQEEIFTFSPKDPSTTSPEAKMKKLHFNISKSIQCVKQGWREDKQQETMLCMSLFLHSEESKDCFLSLSFANKRGFLPLNLYTVFIVIHLPIAYCLHDSIRRYINTTFLSFAMKVTNMRNVLKGSLSLVSGAVFESEH